MAEMKADNITIKTRPNKQGFDLASGNNNVLFLNENNLHKLC